MKIISKLILLCFIIVFVLGNYSYAMGEEKPKIAVMNLNAEGVSAVVANAVGEFLRNDFMDMGKYSVIERAGMEQILAEQKFQLSGCTSQECAVRVGKILNVRKMVVGSVIKLDKYYINIRVVDIETGEIENSVRKSCEGQEGLEKKSRIIAGILSGKKTKEVKSEVPKKAPGTELYSPIRTNYNEWREATRSNNSSFLGAWIFVGLGSLFFVFPIIYKGISGYDVAGSTYVISLGGISLLGGLIILPSTYKKKRLLKEIAERNRWTLTMNNDGKMMLAYNVYWK